MKTKKEEKEDVYDDDGTIEIYCLFIKEYFYWNFVLKSH